MTEYIDREKVEAQLRAYADNVPERFSEVIKGLIGAVVLDLTDAIKDMPTANVRENVKGKWVFKKGDMVSCDDGWYCSHCKRGFHTYVPYFKDFNFCPNCGAEMKRKDR